MQITVKVNPTQALRFLRGIKDSQLPFAMAKGLTMLAQDVQEKMIKELPNRFGLRTKWYLPQTPFGFKVEAAKKKTLVAKVFTRAPWIIGFEKGETRRPAGQVFAEPQPAIRRSKRQLILKGQKPPALLHKARPAVILPTKSGAGIFYRRTKRAPLTFLYALIRRAVIMPRLYFGSTAQQVVQDRFHRIFIAAFYEALRTAR